MQWKIVPRSGIFNLRGMPSREQCMRQEERNQHGISVDVFNNPFASANAVFTSHGRVPQSWEESAAHGDWVQPSTSEPVFSLLHGRHPVCTYDCSVFADTSMKRPVAHSEEQNRYTIPTLSCEQSMRTRRKKSARHIVSRFRRSICISQRGVYILWKSHEENEYNNTKNCLFKKVHALRENRIGGIQEVEESQTSQERQIDKLSTG